MIIELKKFGTTLTSRNLGKEAYLAFLPILKNTSGDEVIELDFEGVNTFTPSWGDEFLTPLQKEYGDKLMLRKTINPSVKATVEILEETNRVSFNWKVN